MALPPSAAGAPPGGMMSDPAAGGMGADPMAGGAPAAGGEQIVLTVAMNSDGSYTVYDGDEDDGDGGDGGGMGMSADDVDAQGGGGTGGGAKGQPADSIGQVLKMAMDILQAGKSATGAPGNADDQLDAGFGASKSPTPARGPSQKY